MKKTIRDIAHAIQRAQPGASFTIRFWDGEAIEIGDSPAFVLWFKEKRALSRTLADAFMGFGESYMAGDIEVEGDLQELFRLAWSVDFANNPISLGLKLRMAMAYILNQNTFTRARKNISHHYDIGNEFYELLLGPTMAYTCAYYHTPEDTIDQAQINKFDHICRKVMLAPGDHIADLGCGWGGLLIHAAKHYGVTGVGVSLSREQVDFANRRIAAEGLADKVEVQFRDYREIEGTYDKLVTVGMMEHVGWRFIPGCFKKISEVLKPGGLGLVHTIGNDTPHHNDPWTEKYLFPGSRVPTLTQLVENAAQAGMNVIDVENLRLHYPPTINAWLDSFNRNEDRIREMFDKTFVRMYRLYMAVSAVSFTHGDNRLFHVVFTNGLANDLPLTREHLYRDR